MLVKVKEATNVQLDWMVAKCEGALYPLGNVVLDRKQLLITIGGNIEEDEFMMFRPSTDWSQGGPIIEQKQIYIHPTGDANKWESYVWNADPGIEHFAFKQFGSTLVAAMRCYVASELGDEVEVPDSLCS